MGYSTFFTGAFKITPKVNPIMACRLNLWLKSRHFDRKKAMDCLMKTNIDYKDVTLFGFGGSNNELFIPSFSKSVNNSLNENINIIIAPHEIGSTMANMNMDDYIASNTNTSGLYGKMPNTIPSLWSNIFIVNDPNENASYLGWNQYEKSKSMEIWFTTIIDWLKKFNFTIEGVVNAQGERKNDFYHMKINNNDKNIKIINKRLGIPTYQKEFIKAMEISESKAQKPFNKSKVKAYLLSDILSIKT